MSVISDDVISGSHCSFFTHGGMFGHSGAQVRSDIKSEAVEKPKQNEAEPDIPAEGPPEDGGVLSAVQLHRRLSPAHGKRRCEDVTRSIEENSYAKRV